MSIGMTVRPASPSEDLYTWRQSAQIQSQTGCIGHLRADLDPEGTAFSYAWEDHSSRLKTDPFIREFQEVIDRLRFGAADENGIRHEDGETFLKSRSSLKNYCLDHPSAQMQPEEEYYGFRADTEDYTYLLRLNPGSDRNNLYCYCYRRDWLDRIWKMPRAGSVSSIPATAIFSGSRTEAGSGSPFMTARSVRSPAVLSIAIIWNSATAAAISTTSANWRKKWKTTATRSNRSTRCRNTERKTKKEENGEIPFRKKKKGGKKRT